MRYEAMEMSLNRPSYPRVSSAANRIPDISRESTLVPPSTVPSSVTAVSRLTDATPDIGELEGILAPAALAAPVPGSSESGYFASYGPGHNVFAGEESDFTRLMRRAMIECARDPEDGLKWLSEMTNLTKVKIRQLKEGYDFYAERPADPVPKF